jgi:hypothetical protein
MRHGLRPAVSAATVTAVAALLVAVGTGWLASDPVRPQPVIELSAVARHSRSSVTDTTPPPPSLASAAEDALHATTVSVEVPGGPLTVVNAPAVVSLRRHAGTAGFRGKVRGVLVADTRGTSAGWRLLVTSTPPGSGAGRVFLGVTRIVATAESTVGLTAEGHVAAASGHAVPLVVAQPGIGNGSFAVTFSVDAWLPDATADHVELALTFAAE